MRQAASLAEREFDMLVIGAGIYGAALAWEATQRGLRVALVEKDDFGGGASAHSLKTIHGGLRYLQNGDIKRMRESSRERRALMRIAPHLVHVLPCVVPTYGHGIRGPEAMRVAMLLNDLITFDRSRGADTSKHIPHGAFLGRDEVLRRFPGLYAEGLNGGAHYYDAQAYNTERLTLAFILTAIQAGAAALNYAPVVKLLERDGVVTGAEVRDRLTGESFDVRARVVVNTAGAWAGRVRGAGDPPLGQAKAVNLIVPALYEGPTALGMSDPGDNQRLYFVSPWRGFSMVGTTYTLYQDDPAGLAVSDADIEPLVAVINRAYPAAKLTAAEVSWVHRGLLPVRGTNERGEPLLIKHPRFTDGRQNGRGLLTVEGVKYTTARDVAERTMNHLAADWGSPLKPSATTTAPLAGGDIDDFDAYVREKTALRRDLPGDVMRSLIYNYGTAHEAVLAEMDRGTKATGRENGAHGAASGQTLALALAQVRSAVRGEMAVRLSDVLFRRTEIGSAQAPDPALVRACAEAMAAELGWSAAQTAQQIDEAGALFTWKAVRA